ncbi:hypothetical protein FRC03_005290 [Tulasnella sp. 419]|nr:hypothetical protein FRC02_001805 [Tulasnella sp. 418]KAG8961525.1 hypothetical protein FRC03_005290 [Tulasnella sp. 419]
MATEIDATDPQVTLAFYKRLYPFKQIYTWLNQQHESSMLFTNREFAFTLIGDVYLRYHSFHKMEELKAQVLRLNPTRFEIGAIYNARPKDKKTLRAGALQPTMRELVFDIDMTDYDGVRTCCDGKGICKRCWGFISAAVSVLDSALRNEFGYKHLLWVYSGRRGIHCWISDRAALELTDDERKAVLSYLEVVKGGKEMTKKVNVRAGKSGLGGLHPYLKDSYERLLRPFEEVILNDQRCFDERSGWETLLELIPDKSIASTLREKWEKEPNRPSAKKWRDLQNQASGSAVMVAAMEDIVLQYTYPRLDVEVSKHRNHLLKAPFCIHPATGRICVPVDPMEVSSFDPETVPTVGQLLAELNNAMDPTKGEHHSDWEGTSLKPYVDMLEKHTAGILHDARERRRAAYSAAPTW